MSRKIPPLNELAARANRSIGSKGVMRSPQAQAARQDLLLYAGAACAGLVQFSATAWVDIRGAYFAPVAISVDIIKRWSQTDPEMVELRAFLEGGPKTKVVEKWIAAGTKAWR